MAKKEMKRPEVTHVKPRNEAQPVPEIQGRAKSGKEKANPLMETSEELTRKVHHDKSHKNNRTTESVFDSDLAKDNLENDLPEADIL